MTTLKGLFKREQIPISAKITRNVVYNAIGLFLLAPLPFIVIPFFLKKLGPAGYGTWAVFLAVSGVTSLADLGLVTSLSKHVAEFSALKDFRSLSRYINTGFVLYLAVAGLLALVLWLGSPLLLSALFHGSLVPIFELRVLWRWLILLVFANTLTLLFSSIVIGLQRMDLSTCISSLSQLLSVGVSLILLSLGWGLRGVLYAYVFAACIASVVYVVLVHRLLPEVKLNPAACQWTVAKEILGFSLKTYVTTVAVVIHNQIEKIYLARFVGVVPVGWYDISSGLALKLRGIPSLVLTPIMPAASELHALSDQRRLIHLYRRAHKYLAFIGVPLVVFVVFISKRFVGLWVGPALKIIAVPLSVLLIANFINLATGPGFLVLVGGGKLRPGIYSATLAMVVNLTLSFFLIRAYGFQGAIIGTSFSLVMGSLFFLFLFQRETGGLFSHSVRRAYLKPLFSSVLVIAVLWVFTHAEVPSWSRLVIEGVIFSPLYLGLLVLLRFFDSFDLNMVERFLPIPRIARRIIPDAELGGALLSDSESAQTTVV